MEEREKESNLQEKYVQVELLNKQLEQVSSQLELLEGKMGELISIKNTIKKVFPGEGYSMLGTGIFLKSEFKDTDSFLVEVGRDIFVKMNKKEAEKHINNKIEKAKNLYSQLSNKAKELQEELQNKILEVQKLRG